MIPNNMTIERARELAAAAWCDERNSKTIMDYNLAESFARILVKEDIFNKLKNSQEFVSYWHDVIVGQIIIGLGLRKKDDSEINYILADKIASRIMKNCFGVESKIKSI